MNDSRKISYMIIEQHGPDDAAIWDVDLPATLFKDYVNEGVSLRGSKEDILDYVEDVLFPSWLTTEDNMSDTHANYVRLFYSKYANCWDYLHHTLENGDIWDRFVREEKSVLKQVDRPATILLLPSAFIVPYINFLHRCAAEANNIPESEFSYDDEDAIAEFEKSARAEKQA